MEVKHHLRQVKQNNKRIIMSWFGDLFSDGASKLVDSVGGAIDSLVTSDEEKLKLRNELQESIHVFKLGMESKAGDYEKEITKRWTSDNEHIITRLIRPVSYAAVLILFGIIVLMDGNVGSFQINPSYIPVVETLLATMTVAYFGSRGVEKTAKHFRKSKD
jgi:hypothetical protein